MAILDVWRNTSWLPLLEAHIKDICFHSAHKQANRNQSIITDLKRFQHDQTVSVQNMKEAGP